MSSLQPAEFDVLVEIPKGSRNKYSGRGRARAIQAAVAGVWHMNLVPVRFRPHVDGHDTTARVSCGAAGR